MKLPDFTENPQLNELRRKMGAELRSYVSGQTRLMTPEELRILTTKGIEIPLRDVEVLNDGTFTFKGRRVIVYIRDVTAYREEYRMPKFHLAMCETLLAMKDEGRYEKRYVVSARDDGLFPVQKIRNNRVVSSEECRLDVCQNCLHGLRYKAFNKNQPGKKKRSFIQDFSIDSFFEEFGRSPVWSLPLYDSTHAPTNIYSVEFYEIARRIKEERGYICEEIKCKRDLSKFKHQRFLHAHHIDGDKSDNSRPNIKLLCIRCHAKMFQHWHVFDLPDYARFCDEFGLKA